MTTENTNNDQPTEVNVCDRCNMPVDLVDGAWQHAEAADSVFCALLFGGVR